MSMIFEGDVQYEQSTDIKRIVDKVVREQGSTVARIGRMALVLDQIFVSTKTPKPKPPKKAKKSPPRMGGAVTSHDGADDPAESEQSGPTKVHKPPHLVVLRWIKPPPAVQAHMKGAKLGQGHALFLEVRTDLWSLMSESDREAAIMTKLLEREVVDLDDGGFKIRKADLPIQTHPAVQERYPNWWENLDPGSDV